jgi:hypothetical protein
MFNQFAKKKADTKFFIMKKVMLFLILGVFALGSSGFNANNKVLGTNCHDYANQAVDNYIATYGWIDRYANAFVFYDHFDYCVEMNEAGVELLEPVFIEN